MNILFVATVYRHLVNFHIPYMQYFQRKGYKVYALGNGDEDKQILSELGIICIDVPFSRNPLSIKNFQAYRDLKKLFNRKEFSLVHVHTPVAAFLTRFVYRKYENPIVYTAHGFHFYYGAPKLNWILYYTTEKIAARWTDHLFVINEEDYLNALNFMPTQRVSYVHGVGIALNQVTDKKRLLKTSLGIKENSVVITYIAELNANKNHKYLLRNWQRIKLQCPEAVLLLIGSGKSEKELKSFVNKLQLRDIYFLGYRRDVEQLLEIAHINVLLSYREGLPKSIMEAMYAGLSNIVTNTRGLIDLVEDGVNGYVVPQDQDAILIERFVALIQSEELRLKMGKEAKRIVTPYLMEYVLLEYSSVYNKFLK